MHCLYRAVPIMFPIKLFLRKNEGQECHVSLTLVEENNVWDVNSNTRILNDVVIPKQNPIEYTTQILKFGTYIKISHFLLKVLFFHILLPKI